MRNQLLQAGATVALLVLVGCTTDGASPDSLEAGLGSDATIGERDASSAGAAAPALMDASAATETDAGKSRPDMDATAPQRDMDAVAPQWGASDAAESDAADAAIATDAAIAADAADADITDASEPTLCGEGEQRCTDPVTHQSCRGGIWQDPEPCPQDSLYCHQGRCECTEGEVRCVSQPAQPAGFEFGSIISCTDGVWHELGVCDSGCTSTPTTRCSGGCLTGTRCHGDVIQTCDGYRLWHDQATCSGETPKCVDDVAEAHCGCDPGTTGCYQGQVALCSATGFYIPMQGCGTAGCSNGTCNE